MIRPCGPAPFARVFWGAVILTSLCGIGSPGLADTEPLEGLEIRSIEIVAPADADRMTIRDTLRTREGDLYRSAAIQADIAALYGLGRFQNVSVETTRLPDGVALTYRLTLRPRVVKITFEGNPAFSDEKMLALLETQVGAPASPYLLKLDREVLLSHHMDKGYVFAEVLQTTRELPDGIEVSYTIEPGPAEASHGSGPLQRQRGDTGQRTAQGHGVRPAGRPFRSWPI